MKEFADIFLENSQRILENIEIDSRHFRLTARLATFSQRRINFVNIGLHNEKWLNLVSIPNYIQFAVEPTILFDIFQDDGKSPSFAIIVENKDKVPLFYISEYFPKVEQLRPFEWAGIIDPQDNQESQVLNYCKMLKDMEYQVNINYGRGLFGVINDHKIISDYVITNANIECFDEQRKLIEGINGRGKFQRFKEMYNSLPKVSLKKI